MNGRSAPGSRSCRRRSLSSTRSGLEPSRAAAKPHDSMVCQGCIISGGHVRRSILSPNVRVNSYAVVEESILFEGVNVGRHCRLRRVIVDKNVKIPPGTIIGYDVEHDRRRGLLRARAAWWCCPRPIFRSL